MTDSRFGDALQQQDNKLESGDILFVFGPARGGTTFLAAVMEQFFDYGMGPEGTFIGTIAKKAERLGDLSNDETLFKLLGMLSSVETLEIIRKRWPSDKSFDVTPDEIFSRMRERTVAAAIYATFQCIGEYQGRKRVGTKNPRFWDDLPLLERLFPGKARYLFIVRDGRDVALSLKNVSWGGQSAYEVAREWRKMIGKVEGFAKVIQKQRLHMVRYEDLLQFPGQTIDEISGFVGETNRTQIREKFEQFATNNQKKANFDKWKTQLPSDEVYLFEAVAGDELARYGYQRVFPNAHVGKLTRLKYELLRILRLVRLNLYNLGRRLPRDQEQWNKSHFFKWIRPGKGR